MNFKYLASLLCLGGLLSQPVTAHTIWSLGTNDNSAKEFALGPSDYKNFLANDFGYEDRYFLVGHSDFSRDIPYVLPGPADGWSGTGGTSGWRNHDLTILFGVNSLPKSYKGKLVIDLVDINADRSVVKVKVNNLTKKFFLDGGHQQVLDGDYSQAKERLLEIPVTGEDLKKGGNEIVISVLEGSWIVFDQIRLEGEKSLKLAEPAKDAFVRNVEAASYELTQEGKMIQPLLVDVEHLQGSPQLDVRLDGQSIFTAQLDTARYVFEAPMPAVQRKVKSTYEVVVNNQVIEKGKVVRTPQSSQTLADYVDTKIGSAHSRWMIAPGPWMPFSMVKLSPDNQNGG